MADQPSSIANLLRDPAERHPQRLYENGVLMHNWAEDRYTGHQKASADRTLLPWVQPPAFEATTLSETERVRREAKSYQPPQWREHTEPYSNDALMHNWYEDRLSRPLAGDSTMRCTAPTLRNHAEQMDAFQTTKTVFDNSMATAPTVNKPAKPTFVTLRNVSSTTHANRTTMRAPEKGFGAVLPSHPPGEGQSYFLTTNRDFVHQGEAQKEAEPNLFVQDRSHLRVAHVHKAIWEEGKRHPDAPGRGGARGEISRHAGESGAKLGAEVFADVYARNFTLQGGRK